MWNLRALLWVLCLVGAAIPAAAQATLPAGFDSTLVVQVPSPTALAFTPDGRMLVTTQPGRLRVVRNDALLTTPALDLAAAVYGQERGLLGVAVDPHSRATERSTFSIPTKIRRVRTQHCTGPCQSRVPLVLERHERVDPAGEVVLIDNMPSPNGNHNGGDLQFGRDGYLYVSVGDGGCDYLGNSGCAGANDASRDAHVLLGKILRIARDGSIPASNPFRGTNSVRCNVTGRAAAGQTCQETFAGGSGIPQDGVDRMPAAPCSSQDVFQNRGMRIDSGEAAPSTV